MIEPIAPQGTAATWQANFAAMQQQLAQNLFQSADVSGNGSISRSEFEAFYRKFMGPASETAAAGQASAADRLFGQLDASGSGRLGPVQFSAALKQMTVQKAQGHPHGATVAGATAGVGAPAAGPSASSGPAGLISALFGAAGGSTADLAAQGNVGASSPGQNSGHLDFMA